MAGKGASVSKLGLLHELLTDMFIEDIRVCTEEAIPMSAADKNCIISFLKNNDITAAPDAEGISELKESFKELSAERKAKVDALIAQANDDDSPYAGILS